MTDDRLVAPQFLGEFSAVTASRSTVLECGLSASEPIHSGPLIEAISKATHLIVLSPHLDDGVLSCGALMSYVRKEIPVTIVTFFTEGCPAPYTYSARRYLRKCESLTADSLFLTRRTEDQEVLENAGISYVHVGLTEALFRRRKRPLLNWLPWASRLAPELCYLYPTYRLHVIRGRIPSDDADTVRHIIDVIDRIPSKSSALFLAPLAIGSHKDHVLVRTAASKSGKPVAYYSDFPYNTIYQIDPSFAQQNSLVPAVWSQDLVAKQSLIRGYRTQVDALFPGGEIPIVPEVYLLPEQQTPRLHVTKVPEGEMSWRAVPRCPWSSARTAKIGGCCSRNRSLPSTPRPRCRPRSSCASIITRSCSGRVRNILCWGARSNQCR